MPTQDPARLRALGQRLKALREDAGLSHLDVSARTKEGGRRGVSKNVVISIEQGHPARFMSFRAL